jgi:hypothetical protein
MNKYIVGAVIYALLVIIGTVLSLLVSTLKCNKTSTSASMQEGLIWGSLPTILYLMTLFSPFVLSTFSEPIRSFSPSLTPEMADMLGTGYLMMLGSWVMSTRMIHTTEIAVCKPSKDELKKFQDDLMKELKEKEAEKEANAKKTTS